MWVVRIFKSKNNFRKERLEVIQNNKERNIKNWEKNELDKCLEFFEVFDTEKEILEYIDSFNKFVSKQEKISQKQFWHPYELTEEEYDFLVNRKIKNIIAKCFYIDENEISNDDYVNRYENIDELEIIELTMTIENYFGIEFYDEEIDEFSYSVNELVTLCKERKRNELPQHPIS